MIFFTQWVNQCYITMLLLTYHRDPTFWSEVKEIYLKFRKWVFTCVVSTQPFHSFAPTVPSVQHGGRDIRRPAPGGEDPSFPAVLAVPPATAANQRDWKVPAVVQRGRHPRHKQRRRRPRHLLSNGRKSCGRISENLVRHQQRRGPLQLQPQPTPFCGNHCNCNCICIVTWYYLVSALSEKAPVLFTIYDACFPTPFAALSWLTKSEWLFKLIFASENSNSNQRYLLIYWIDHVQDSPFKTHYYIYINLQPLSLKN